MSTVKLNYFIFGILLQILINSANGSPIWPGDCDPCYESRFNYDCGPAPAVVPIPQPVPVRVPVRERCQSVTIPNIIMALLPPNNNKPIVHRPVIRPPPVILPTPQLPLGAGFGGFGGFGGFEGFRGFEGCGGSGFGRGLGRFEGCGCL